MATTATLATLRGRALDLADLTNSSSPSSTYVNVYINDAICELHDMLVNSYEDYYRSVSTITLAAGAESYSLPSDFYKALKVFAVSGSTRFKVPRFTLDEFEFLRDEVAASSIRTTDLRYRIMGASICFAPIPIAGGTVELWYAPAATTLSGDSSTLTVYAPVSWWEEYIALSAAVKLKVREDSDAGQLMALMERCRQRIENASQERDSGEPSRISDVSGRLMGDYLHVVRR